LGITTIVKSPVENLTFRQLPLVVRNIHEFSVARVPLIATRLAPAAAPGTKKSQP
jgi:hypothetical protein